VALTVIDSASPQNHASANYSIKIGPLTIATTSVAVGAINLPYSFIFSATGGYPPYTWNETGALPPGLNLAADGTLSGIPTATGSFPITVSVVDSNSQTATPANLTVEIAAHGFKATGSMANARSSHTATLLQDGRVLVTGGWGTSNGPINSAELYDPLTHSFSPANSLIHARTDHTATLLNDGRVLVAGGHGVTAAEVYDPTSGNFVGAGTMQVDRDGPTATLLKDGRVLVTGGTNNGISLASAEIFDPNTNSFSPTGSMSSGRQGHTATLLSNGTVLVAGGFDGTARVTSAELYDPATGKFAKTGSMSNARSGHTATALNNNTVVVIGGINDSVVNVLTAEIYNPATGVFSTSGMSPVGFADHTATLLNNGQVLVAGGDPAGVVFTVVSAAVLFDPASGTFSFTGSMTNPREAHTATLLNNGTVLVVGGSDITKLLDTTELYQ
jgi:hypothetical protein